MGIHLTAEQIMEFIPILAPLILLQAILLIVSLFSILRKKAPLDKKFIWMIVVVFISIVGPVIYFAIGAKQLDEGADKRGE